MAYSITTRSQTTLMGKRTGQVLACVESEYSANVASATGKTISEAKTALINYLGALAGNPERAYIFCGDSKTILIVSFAGGAWQYDIIDASRTNRCGCIMGNCATFRAAKEQAYAHAEQSYGGVLNVL